jgi:hypothetical protein
VRRQRHRFDPSRKVRAGEHFVVDVPPATPVEPAAGDRARGGVQDEHLLVIDKPAASWSFRRRQRHLFGQCRLRTAATACPASAGSGGRHRGA